MEIPIKFLEHQRYFEPCDVNIWISWPWHRPVKGSLLSNIQIFKYSCDVNIWPWHRPVERFWPPLVNRLPINKTVREPDLPTKSAHQRAEDLKYSMIMKQPLLLWERDRSFQSPSSYCALVGGRPEENIWIFERIFEYLRGTAVFRAHLFIAPL